MLSYIHRRILFITIILIYIIGCKKPKNDKIDTSSNSLPFKIEVLKDSVSIGEFIKCLAYLDEGSTKGKISGIMVAVEQDENYLLKQDLSNELDIPMEYFVNLALDTINQKWFDNYKFTHTCVFGRSWPTSGNKKIRGYLLIYKNITPTELIAADFKNDRVQKFYFEEQVYVVESR